MDAVDFLKEFPDESVNCIVTDPAYESLEKHRSKGTTTRLKESDGSSNQWFPIFPNSRFDEFYRECHRVLKKDSHLYTFSDCETLFIMKPVGENVGFKFWKDLIWLKMTKDMKKIRMGMGYHYRNTNERVLFFEKGKRKLKDLSMIDVFQYPRPPRGGYPTEKPWEIARDVISQCTDEGDLVIDPFMGGGSTGYAALTLGRNFIGNDKVDFALKYSQEKLGPRGVKSNLLENLQGA